METSIKSYRTQEYHQPVKRYCRTLDLRNDPELIAEYRRRHSRENIWPEVMAGIREVGILEMEIYILGTDRKSTRLNSSHYQQSRMPSSA